MKKKKLVKLIKGMIDDLEAGRAKHWWDAQHMPREGERAGRVAMLLYILEQIEAGESDG